MTAGPFEATSVAEAYEKYLVPVIFTPWAKRFVDFAGVSSGDAVLDVASGTGVVAAESAGRVGPGGRVVATDVSSAMLAEAAQQHGSISTVVAAADDLDQVGEQEFDVALCHQGFQFMPDRLAAAESMRRTLRRGGIAAISVWSPVDVLEPFDVYGRVLQADGLPEPFPGGYAFNFVMAEDEIAQLLTSAGFADVEVVTETLEITWPSVDQAVSGLSGTPYGPAVAALDAERQERIGAALRARLRRQHQMSSVFGRGRAPRSGDEN
ncbi:MAG TPA: methyltransferase domain-containing protein [Acidimicrobiales bacterium]|jgi:SAM-dependent methyltransferase|nr:methyltransferase domain-containing protein [Acidimicrobiales bacterium]